MITLDFKSAKANFFDRKKVANAVDRATKKALNAAGRMIRAAAQKSLAYGDKASRPGSPPTAHRSRLHTRVSKTTGKSRTRAVSYLREFLFYSYDPANNSVVVGPVRLGSTVDPGALPALEYGGSSTVEDRRGVRRRIQVRPRPFMGPALRQELPGLPAMWRDSVR